TIKSYIKKRKYHKILGFFYSYFKSKKSNDRYIYYKNILKSIPMNMKEYDAAIAYAGPTEIIDAYITHKIKAKLKISWVHFDISHHEINKKLYTKLYERFNKIFVVSKNGERILNKQFPVTSTKSQVFNNLVSHELIKDMAQEKIDFDNGFKGIRILTIGRLSKEKGQDLAISVLDKLKKQGYKVRWYCVGEGNDRDEYERLIENLNLRNDFILLGETINPYPYIKASDIYVQPSRHEGYGITIAEAKCLNKPIVITNFIGSNEQIEDGQNGLIAECTLDKICDKIKFLIDNPKVSENFSKALSREKIDTTCEVSKLCNYIN
nr:glycosyltransferase [Clostridium sp.]